MTVAVNSFAASLELFKYFLELFAARVKRDHEDYTKLKSWFDDHNLFEAKAGLVAIDTGLTDVEGKITCDRVEEIGALIQIQVTGKNFSECSFKKKSQLATLQSPYPSIKIGKEKVITDPLTLFLGLVVMVKRKPEEEKEKHFEYKLSPNPMSLFKHGCMRSNKKSKLKSFLLADSTTADDKPKVTKITDGGALLWCCNWKKMKVLRIYLRCMPISYSFCRSTLLCLMLIHYQRKILHIKSVLEKQVQLSR